MKTKILRVPVALGLSLLLWSGAGLAETRCQNESFSVITDFDGANIHSCHMKTGGSRDSSRGRADQQKSWYAFACHPPKAHLRVVLNYDGTSTAINPTSALTGTAGKPLPDDAVELDEAEKSDFPAESARGVALRRHNRSSQQ